MSVIEKMWQDKLPGAAQETLLGNSKVQFYPTKTEGFGALYRLFEIAAQYAKDSECLKARCGCILITGHRAFSPLGRTIGACNESPTGSGTGCPANDPQPLSPFFRSDRTCCIHAEQEVILRATAAGLPIPGSLLVFVRVDAEGKIIPSGAPYCTICSKMALRVEVGGWLLLHADGIRAYDAHTYNRLSFAYGSPALKDWPPASHLKEDLLVEDLAGYAHQAWSSWMKHLFELSPKQADGSRGIPPHFVERWDRQAATEYSQLPEEERDTDRQEAQKMLDVMRAKRTPR